jgi:2,4-dienoyl-CoA reductase-like NADH-dependent reductase (Old Yellow Enzyme family)
MIYKDNEALATAKSEIHPGNAGLQGRADPVSFGRLFMANPDPVRRLSENAPLIALMAPETFYGGGAHGYTDYSFLNLKGADAVMVEPTAA